MTKKFAVSILFVLVFGLMALIGVTAGSPGQNSQRGECEQKCTETYQTCRGAANANQADCKRAFDSCRAACKEVKPHPSPTAMPTPETIPSPTPETTPSPTPETTPSPTPTPDTPDPSQRGECQQKCTEAYATCRGAANANQADCKRAFDSCRAACKDVEPHPSPSPTPETTPSPRPGR